MPDKLIERLRKATTHVERLERLVSELLDVSRISSGRLELHLEEVDVTAVVDEVVDRFAEQLTRAGKARSWFARAGAPPAASTAYAWTR